MPQNKKPSNLKSYRRRVKQTPPAGRSRKVDLVLLVVSLAVILFVGSFVLKYSIGQSKPPPPPPAYLRFQVLNGCGQDGAAARFADHIRERSTEQLVMDVIEEANHSSFDHPQTQLIARDASVAEIESVLEALELPESRLIQKKLDDNFLDINFTVLVGEDFLSILGESQQQTD
jgi:hypothetical protein